MKSLGFHIELATGQAFVSCACIGLRKRVLRTATGISFSLDLQDVAFILEAGMSRASSHNMVSFKAGRLLFNKRLSHKKKKKLWWLLGN